MMIAVGNFFFRHRNLLFPFLFLLMVFDFFWPICPAERGAQWLLAIGLLVALSGQTLRAITVGLAYIKRGGKDKQVYAKSLVQEGIFAHCRNPLYLGNVLILTGVGIASNSMLFIVVGVPLFLFAYASIIAAEENYLRGRFGAEFDEYCRRVNRLIPRFTGLAATMRGMEFHWQRLIVKEYQTPFVWMGGLTLLVMKHYWRQQNKVLLGSLLVWLVLLSAAFLTAWGLKKTKILRAD
jgi:protein-S-isoprenylcysteine O-methyltransferase Ste14